MLRLAPGAPAIIDEIPTGRLYKDGALLIPSDGRTIAERRKLSFAGMVFVAIAVTDKGVLVADPEIDLMGIPEKGRSGDDMADIVYDAVMSTVETLPKPRRRDPDAMAESVRRAVRSALAGEWGKKPACHVHVLVV
jgi:ribonuclease J